MAMLERIGCEVKLVENGLEVLAALHDSAFDLVLMDCQMPELDGYEVARIIRENEKKGAMGPPSPIPIIALTAHAMEGDCERCLAAGMDAYLSKPFTRDELFNVLRRRLPVDEPHCATSSGGASSTRSATSPPAALPPSGNHALVPLPREEKAKEVRSVDTSALDSIRALQEEGGPDVLERVIRSYNRRTPELLSSLYEAIHRGDAEAVRNAAHSLKSSSATVGARLLADLCGELEAMGRESRLEDAGSLVAQLKAEYERVESNLIQELQGGSK